MKDGPLSAYKSGLYTPTPYWRISIPNSQTLFVDEWEEIASNESSSSDDLSADMEIDDTEDSDLIVSLVTIAAVPLWLGYRVNHVISCFLVFGTTNTSFSLCRFYTIHSTYQGCLDRASSYRTGFSR